MASPFRMLTAKDLTTDQEVRWCPGCGDFSILAQLKRVLAGLNLPREKMVFVSGSGCSGRLPFYMNTYGFHTLHGRAPAFATGLKIARPELSVWVVTGDGDALSVGTNHLLHALRRNVDIKILLFNNEVLGLSKGQYSPTSRPGTRSQSSRDGSFETALQPLSMALAAEASFVARTVDVDVDHLTETLRRAAAHRGSAFVEIYQNCTVFNDGVFDYATDKNIKADNTLRLEHGKPLLFGKDHNRGLRLRGLNVEAVTLSPSVRVEDLLVHDEQAEQPTLALVLSRLTAPDFPECLGVFRSIRRPTYEEGLAGEIADAVKSRGKGKLDELFAQGDTWTVK